jgi:hypothetical protein
MRPPVSHIRIGRQRMTHPYHIAVRFIQPAERMISNVNMPEFLTALQLKRLRMTVNLHFFPIYPAKVAKRIGNTGLLSTQIVLHAVPPL